MNTRANNLLMFQHFLFLHPLDERVDWIFWLMKCPKIYSSGISTSPSLIPSIMSWGGCPSTVHPTDWHVPRISLTVPLNSFAKDLYRIVRAMLMTSSRGMLPECAMFLTFFRSRGASAGKRDIGCERYEKDIKIAMYLPFKARMTSELAAGTIETAACLFWTVNWTVTRRPFQSPLALAISSPTFLGDCEKQISKIDFI